MPIFPKIQSPCPYKSDLAAVMDGDFCRACKRTVFDLTAMEDGERVAFLAACEDEVCVSYRIPVRGAIAAAALAAATVSAPALAQDAPAPAIEAPVEADAIAYEEEIDMITVGGIKDPKKVEMVEVDTDSVVPELPVIYEEESAPAPVTSKAGRATGS
jgi:predicted Fe-S protein YdhL (DUF1289 family)